MAPQPGCATYMLPGEIEANYSQTYTRHSEFVTSLKTSLLPPMSFRARAIETRIFAVERLRSWMRLSYLLPKPHPLFSTRAYIASLARSSKNIQANM